MSEYIAEEDMEREKLHKKVDEMHKLCEEARQNIDAIITMLDEILTQEEGILLREDNQHCAGYARNLSLEEQEFLRQGNAKLEP